MAAGKASETEEDFPTLTAQERETLAGIDRSGISTPRTRINAQTRKINRFSPFRALNVHEPPCK